MGAPIRVLRAIWRLLPERLRTLAPAMALKQMVFGAGAPRVPAPPPDRPRPRLIHTIDELDAAIHDLEAAASISDDELRRGFETFEMRVPLDLPADPDSEEYRAVQLQLYARLHGRPYTPANEVSAIDPVAAADRPFPFQTGSAGTVGDQLIAIGFLIQTLNLSPGSRVLELGAGWGNTTIALARMGCAVTAIDIEPNFIALLDERSRRKHLAIETIQGDFSIVDRLDRTFDAALFFESFHHCANHQALIASLARVVAPGGQVAFAGEPISVDFPIPWGLRLDGQSLWAIRRHGWLELGFREDYFVGLLARHGWSVRKSVCAGLSGDHEGWGTVFTAMRRPAAS